jgi:ferritin-like metal-binding protein YciE
MKTINTLEDALTMELDNLYSGEKKLKESFLRINNIIHSDELRDIIRRYAESCDSKRVKIERVLSYLHHEPNLCGTNVIDELIDDSFHRLAFAQDPDVQQQILINCIERINAYKTCVYEACIRYAEELNMDVAAEQLFRIIQWEREIKRELIDLSVHDFSTKEYLV